MKEQIHKQLKDLASVILNENEISIKELKERTLLLYEQLTIIEYNTASINPKPVEKENLASQIEESNSIIEETFNLDEEQEVKEEVIVEDKIEEVETLEITPESNKNTVEEEIIVKEEKVSQPTLLHELEDLTAGFNLPDFEPLETVNNTVPKPKTSLNDILSKGLQIGLNDKIAFTKHLFNNNQEDLTRVVSQINTKENLSEAKQFLYEIIKPEYGNWEGKEDYENRFIELIERNFES